MPLTTLAPTPRASPSPSRREVVAALPLIALTPTPARAASPFGWAQVRAQARALGGKPYAAPVAPLPAALEALDYDQYRDIRFDPSQAVWRDLGLPFQLQFFHRGGLQRERIDIFEVADGVSRPLAYAPTQFRFQRGAPAGLRADLGFAGFRIHAPINRPDRFDEVAAFLGASYFRAVARGMLYGLSARGLAIGTGGKEEFPSFRTFWIERPRSGARSLTVMALMDAPSCAGAFRFVITPGEITTFDTTAVLFPRREIADAGITPLTSMFLYAGDGARRFDDFRPQVHDSDGLGIADAGGPRVWRPLVNPATVQISAFQVRALQGFGLAQRERRYGAYLDLEARYHLRPSAWVEPAQGFAEGEVRLVELPARTEYEDNVVAFWTPARPLRRGIPAEFAYRLKWGPESPSPGLARVVDTRVGAAARAARRRFVVEFDGPPGAAHGEVGAELSASAGRVVEIQVHPNPESGGWRLSFELEPEGARTVELRAVLSRSAKICSEVWLHRWTA